MKKGAIILIVIGVVFVALFMSFKSSFNGMTLKQEDVSSAWSNVENQYQRRADLIPNLVNTVKGYAEHESSTLTEVTKARAEATKVNLNVDQLDEQSLAAFNKAQGALSSALSKLLVVSERYPDLKANENFRDLQAQLEGTENRISTERGRFNESVKSYNTYIRMFPRNMIASMFGFMPKAYFSAEAGSEKAPVVEF